MRERPSERRTPSCPTIPQRVRLEHARCRRWEAGALRGAGSEGGSYVAVDGSGSAYILGSTNSTNFPTARPLQATNAGGYDDAFVTKLNDDT
jgi:hypothetical protein